jgi:hypothetical protein
MDWGVTPAAVPAGRMSILMSKHSYAEMLVYGPVSTKSTIIPYNHALSFKISVILLYSKEKSKISY